MQKFTVTFRDGRKEVVKAKSFLALASLATKSGWEWTQIEVYVPKMVKRRNLMSGLEYEEPEDTPAFLSPSCESYWSM
jgi:hypothetical protein